jgi:cytochrome oxidase Cu insertion factor (SCO1/SenC/PrrC family)
MTEVMPCYSLPLIESSSILKVPIMKSAIIFSLLLIASATLVHAQAEPSSLVKLPVPDLEVVDQNGHHLRFSSDVLKDRTAVINTFFTNCAAICPITQETFSKLAKSLSSRLGHDLVLISISVDPEHDTPERMKIWGQKFNVGKGWLLLSGNKAQTEELLKSLRLFAPGNQRHQTAVLIGNRNTGWIRASGFASEQKLQKLVDDFATRTMAGN